MAYTQAEIYDAVREIEMPFESTATDAGDKVMSLRDRINLVDQIVFTRYDYAKALAPDITQPISMGADLLRHYMNIAVAKLRRNVLKLHLEPVGDLKRHETDADMLEVAEAHIKLKLDPYNNIREDMLAYMVRSFFYAAWLEEAEYCLPEQAPDEKPKDYNARVDQYKRAWFPWTLTSKNLSTVAWMEFERLPTFAVQRFKLPLYEWIERYAKVPRENREEQTRAFNSSFGWLRHDEPVSDMYARDFWAKEIEVCVVADKQKICHYVDMGKTIGKDYWGANKSLRYRADGYESEYDNPFGQVPLLLAEGTYNPGQPIAYRREPLMSSLIMLEDKRAIVKSHLVSRAASPPIYLEKLPPEALAVRNELGEQAIARTVMGGPNGNVPVFQRVFGDAMELKREADQYMREFLELVNGERDIAAPSALLFSDDPKLDMAASNVLHRSEEEASIYGGAVRSETNFWSRCLDMVEHAFRTSRNGHRVKGEPKRDSDQPFAFTTTSKEEVYKKKIERGMKIEVTPQMLDRDYVRTIEPVDTRLSTQSAQRQEADARWAAGTILYDERLEMSGVENVSEFKTKKWAETVFQIEMPNELLKVRMEVAQAVAMINGVPLEAALSMMPETMMPQIAGGLGMQPAGAPQGQPQQNGQQNGNGATGQGYQMRAPQTSSSGVGVETAAMT